MGYQEILVKSDKIPAEDMAGILQRKADSLFIDSADTVAVLRNDFSSSRAIIFGQEIDTGKLEDVFHDIKISTVQHEQRRSILKKLLDNKERVTSKQLSTAECREAPEHKREDSVR